MSVGADDQRYFIKGAEDLADYLASPVLFWPLTGESQPLTAGNLLLAQKKVAAVFSNQIPGEIALANSKIDKAKADRPAAWQKKAEGDLHARINQYRTLIDDLDRGGYGVLARLRAILEVLFNELPDQEDLRAAVNNLDQRLKGQIVSGDFIWQETFQPAFPAGKYWFLYAKPRSQVLP